MFKKITATILSVLLLSTVPLFNAKPVFKGYSSEYEVYINSASSSAEIIRVSEKEFPFVKEVCGEAIKIELGQFSLEKFLEEFSAKVVFIEEISEGVSYYAFSKKIKYRKKIRGKTVNLQIFVGESVTVGTPIICGSF